MDLQLCWGVFCFLLYNLFVLIKGVVSANNSLFFQIFPHTEKIENINDQYWTLRAEEASSFPPFFFI